MRAMVSVGPPGGTGTTRVTGRSGKALGCATDCVEIKVQASRTLPMSFFTVSSLAFQAA
jgi:hypothetical protein